MLHLLMKNGYKTRRKSFHKIKNKCFTFLDYTNIEFERVFQSLIIKFARFIWSINISTFTIITLVFARILEKNATRNCVIKTLSKTSYFELDQIKFDQIEVQLTVGLNDV